MVYLQEKTGDLASCLRSLFLNVNPKLKAKAFDWIEETFEKMTLKEREKFKKNVMVYIGTLAELDTERTVKLVKNQFEDDHNLPISALNSKPETQLRYIDSWRHAESLQGSTIPKDMLEVYIRLIGDYRPTDLLPVLRSIDDLPYEFCLNVCQGKGLTDCIAYLYEAQGDYKGALDTYIQILEDRRSRMQERMKTEMELTRFEMNELKETISKAMTLCVHSNGDSDAWYSLMDKVFLSFKTFMPYFEKYKRVEEIISEGVSEVLGKIVVHLDLDEVVSRLVDSFKGIPFKIYGSELVNILKRYSFQKRLLITAQGSIAGYVKSLSQAGLMLRQQGFTCTQLQCVVCHRALTSSPQVRLFVCGHGQHTTCSESDPVCPICQLQESKQEKIRRLLEKPRH